MKRFRKILDQERRNLFTVRLQLKRELESRSELECLMRDAVERVRKKSQTLRLEDDPPKVKSTEFSAALELLLSEERVLNLLYVKTFPSSPKSINPIIPPGAHSDADPSGLSPSATLDNVDPSVRTETPSDPILTHGSPG